jgi:hypothetical protein
VPSEMNRTEDKRRIRSRPQPRRVCVTSGALVGSPQAEVERLKRQIEKAKMLQLEL